MRYGYDVRKGYSRFAFRVIEVEVKEAAERPGDDHAEFNDDGDDCKDEEPEGRNEEKGGEV